jgi:hypothetical protein
MRIGEHFVGQRQLYSIDLLAHPNLYRFPTNPYTEDPTIPNTKEKAQNMSKRLTSIARSLSREWISTKMVDQTQRTT